MNDLITRQIICVVINAVIFVAFGAAGLGYTTLIGSVLLLFIAAVVEGTEGR